MITGAEAMPRSQPGERGTELSSAEPRSRRSPACSKTSAPAQGRLVLVRGEAGVGKTALVRRFTDDAAPARVLRGPATRCTRPGRSGRSSTSPTRRAASSSGPQPAGSSRTRSPRRSCASWRSRAFRRADRRRALGGRGDPRRAAHRGAPRRDPARADRRDLPRRRARPAAPAPAGPRRAQPGDPRPGSPSSRSRPRRSPLSPRPTASTRTTSTARRGNAFFVTEVLAADGAEVPDTARDAVLARAARLTRKRASSRGRRDRPTPRRARDPRGDRPGRRGRTRGMPLLRDAAHRRRRRLLPPRARPARDRESIPAHRRTELNRVVLAALESLGGEVADPARLAHHAEAAGDVAASCATRRSPGTGPQKRERIAKPRISSRGRWGPPRNVAGGNAAICSSGARTRVHHRPEPGGARCAPRGDRVLPGGG